MKFKYVEVLLSDNLRLYRNIFNLSQKELAEKIGCSSTMIGNIENLKRFPSPETINRMTKALNIAPEFLFSEREISEAYIRNLFSIKDEIKKNILEAIEKTFNEIG